MSMQFTHDRVSTKYAINGYTQDSITINQTEYRTSLLLSPEYLQTDVSISTIQQLTPEYLQSVVELQLEVLLIGQCNTVEFPHPTTAVWLSQQGIGMEVMAHDAACRTFNILASEGRRVGALFLLSPAKS